jgi:6-phosphogluconolactonase (cycloisomerase 2 family)
MGMRWSRREFVQWAGFSSLNSAGLCSSLLPLDSKGSSARFAYVASSEGVEEGIHAYAVRQGRWEKLQTLQSRRPVALVIASNRRFLYAVNEIDSHEGLPTGTVEAFAIEADGRLRFLNRSPLALSATMPRHAAVTTDGRSLVVAVHGGGAYNVLPIAEDGSVGRVSGILKEVGVERGASSRTAHPVMVALDKQGRVISVDEGAGRLNVLSVNENGIAPHTRVELGEGGGATQVTMHPSGNKLYVMQGEAIACHGYDAAEGRVLEPTTGHLLVRGAMQGHGAIAVHPSGRFLYVSQRDGGIATWRLTARGDGTKGAPETQAEQLHGLHGLEIAPDGKSLVGISRNRGLIQQAEIDSDTGSLRATETVARLNSPSSLVMLYS